MQERVFVARHMRSLSHQIMEAGHHICRDLHPLLEPTWGGLINMMRAGKTLTVTAAAKRLSISHVHAQKILKTMLVAEVVSASADPDDGRSTLYQLTPSGEQLVPIVDRLGMSIEAVLQDIKRETGHDLAEALSSFASALESRGWTRRVNEKLNSEREEQNEFV